MKTAAISSLFFFVMFGTAFGQNTDKDSEDVTTVRGCMQHARQNYTVVDSKGFAYVLEGVGDKLKGEVGHLVIVKGTLIDDTKTGVRSEKQGSNPTDTLHASEGAATLRIANVATDVKRVADKCPSR